MPMFRSIKIPLFVLLSFALSNETFAQANSSSIELNIFPNPNRGTFYITLVSEKSHYAKLYAMDGRFASTLFLQNGLNFISIDVKPGLYILIINEESEENSFKIEIK